jgi:hypothetical protein
LTSWASRSSSPANGKLRCYVLVFYTPVPKESDKTISQKHGEYRPEENRMTDIGFHEPLVVDNAAVGNILCAASV